MDPTTDASSSLPPLPTPEAFPFPYPKPYDIQLQLMQVVFRAIEDSKITIVESPTGTGKSLSLLTSTLTWLAQHQSRLDTAIETSLRSQLSAEDPDEPAWAIEHAVKARMKELRAGQEERRERLERARRRERKVRREAGMGSGAFGGKVGAGKRVKVMAGEVDGGKGARGEDEFLPEDKDEEENEEGPYLSKEVRELMSKYETSRPKHQVEEEEEEDVPKIYYTSRTHTQLRQLTSELFKTSFAPDPDAPAPASTDPADASATEGVSLVPLGSRKQLCINDKVRALAKGGGDERLNEACLDMQKSGRSRCEFLPTKEEEGKMLDARDSVLASVKDIEDIVTAGRKACVCPYYATRRAVKQSQIVTLPYNLLLQKNAREALGINLKSQVVVIDEAHNLIDTLLSIHSTSLTSTHLSNAVSQLNQYHQRFKARLKPVHALWIRQVLNVLQGLIRVCDKFLAEQSSKGKDPKGGKGPKSEVLNANALLERAGGGSDQLNPMELVAYLKESKLARKISGFSEHLAEKAAEREPRTSRSTTARHASIAAFHIVESFLLSLVDAKDDGRVLLSIDDSVPGKASTQVVTIKYVLLNPAERFKEVVEDARSVVLAGGTMEPITDFLRQLFPSLPPERFATLSCAHVIPKENLLTQVVCCGPRKVDFEFKYSNRGDGALLTDLGAVIQSTVGLVPDGVVVFVPSYSFLDKVKAFWTQSGLLPKLGARKELFYEPQTSGDVESILRDYALAISSCQAGTATAAAGTPRKTGALLFAVVGGKLSEGINFSDSLGRCVIMVGLPFANVGSVELQERMRYVEKLPGAGPGASREMYENLCMRAVNQSIGRAIRHANDYACILLVDRRYATSRIRNKLPKWIGEDVKVQTEFGGVARGLSAFFRKKKAKASA
ncbi:hypothetical protein IAT38_000597 [Cryptococcus sp. DSM 104549]